MMKTYLGKCMGGPMSEQDMRWHEREKEFFRFIADHGPFKIGTYVLNDFGQWVWLSKKEDEEIMLLYGFDRLTRDAGYKRIDTHIKNYIRSGKTFARLTLDTPIV